MILTADIPLLITANDMVLLKAEVLEALLEVVLGDSVRLLEVEGSLELDLEGSLELDLAQAGVHRATTSLNVWTTAVCSTTRSPCRASTHTREATEAIVGG